MQKAKKALVCPRVVPQAYFHRKDADGTKRGHYLKDERKGLSGRHSPTVVSEILRLAAIYDYGEVAHEFEKAHGFRLPADAVRDIVIGDSDNAAKSLRHARASSRSGGRGSPTSSSTARGGTSISIYFIHQPIDLQGS